METPLSIKFLAMFMIGFLLGFATPLILNELIDKKKRIYDFLWLVRQWFCWHKWEKYNDWTDSDNKNTWEYQSCQCAKCDKMKVRRKTL